LWKYGITSSKKNPKGTPKRTAMQMAKLKRQGLNPVNVARTFDRRKTAMNWETQSITSGKKKGLKLPGNKRIPRLR
jgi:hypothetical protein